MKLFYTTATWRPKGCKNDRVHKAIILAETREEAINKFMRIHEEPLKFRFDASETMTDVFTFS